MINEGKLTFTQQLRLLSLIVAVGLLLSIIGHLIIVRLGFQISTNLTTKINFFSPVNWIKLAALCMAEEIIFRGVLSLSVRATCVSILFWFILLFSYLSKIIFNFNAQEIHYYPLFVGVYALLSLCVTYLIYRKYLPLFISIFKSNYNSLFWVLCTLFALVHVDNYVNHNSNLLIYLILVVPQFIMGSLLAVVRVRNGIISSAVIHFLVDVWFFVFGLESSMSSHPALKVAVGIVLAFILLMGLTQIKLCKNMAYVLMKPSIRILGRSKQKQAGQRIKRSETF